MVARVRAAAPLTMVPHPVREERDHHRTELLKGVLPLDKWGCVETDDSMATSIPGL